MGDLHVVQVRSAIGTKPKQRGTLRSLGLGRIGKTNVLPDRPEIRGMIAKVPHLIEVTDSSGASAAEPSAPAAAAPAAAAPDAEADGPIDWSGTDDAPAADEDDA
jgi:large subunit ribosomal protein L30